MSTMDRKQPPFNPELKPFSPERLDRYTLSNGVPVCYVPTIGNELVRIDFCFRGGQWFQQYPLQTHYSTLQLKEGTKTYPADTLADLLDKYGATIGVSSTLSFSYITVYCLRKFVDNILAVVESMITEPLYDKDRLALAISRGKVSHRINRRKVSTICREGFYRNIFGVSHPASKFPVIADYDAVTPEMLDTYRRQYVNMGDCMIYVAGTEDDGVKSILERRFGSMPVNRGVVHNFTKYELDPSDEKRLFLPVEGDNVQSALRIGKTMTAPSHIDSVRLRLTNVVLGGYFGGRFISQIREKLGLTYDISSYIVRMPYTTLFVVTSETEKGNEERLESEVYSEIDKLKNEGIGEAELNLVKNYVIGESSRQLEAGYNLPSLLMRLNAAGSSYEETVNDCALIRSLTSEDIQDTISRILDAESMKTVVAG